MSSVAQDRDVMKKRQSTLGIAALIISIIPYISIAGLIMAIVDLCRPDGYAKTCSKIAIGFGVFWLLALIAVIALLVMTSHIS